MSLIKKRLAQAAAIRSGENTDGSKKTTVIEQSKSQEKQAPEHSIERDKIMKDFEMYQIAMESDLAQLKQFSDIEKKQQYKREALENNNYMQYVEDYVNSGANHPNNVLAWVFVWLTDLQRWNQVLELLPLMVEQKQPLPTKFNTKHWATFVIDQLYDSGVKGLEKGREAIESSGIIRPFYVLTELCEKGKWDINEVVLGKLYAMHGKLEQQRFNFGNALALYVKATAINDKAGVKKAAKDIAKQLNIEIDI